MKYDDERVGPSAAGITVSDSLNLLSLEARLSSTERRRSARIPMRHPVVLSWLEGETERVETAYTTTISRHGCSLHCRMFFQPGARVRLELSEKTMEGRVVHSLKDHSTGVVTIGVALDYDARNFWKAALGVGHSSLWP